jgi:hypothetical protein
MNNFPLLWRGIEGEAFAGKRTRVIEKKLKDVQVLSTEDANKILPMINDDIVNDEE